MLLGATSTKVANQFTKGYTNVGFFAGRSKKTFCAEFLDEAFKEAGIFLTPKSKVSATVTPADILNSPYIQFMGVLVNQEEYAKQRKEEVLLVGAPA